MVDSLIELVAGRIICSVCSFCLPSRPENRGDQDGESIPGDLHPYAEQNERNDPQHAMRGRRRNDLGDLWSIGVAEIDQHTENDHGKKHADVGLKISRNIAIRDIHKDQKRGSAPPKAVSAT